MFTYLTRLSLLLIFITAGLSQGIPDSSLTTTKPFDLSGKTLTIAPGYTLVMTKVSDPISGKFLSLKKNKIYFEDGKTLYIVHLKILESMRETNRSVTVKDLKARIQKRINFNAYSDRITLSGQTDYYVKPKAGRSASPLSKTPSITELRTHRIEQERVAQVTRNLVNSPLSGFTRTPPKGHLSLYMGYEYFKSTSYFNPKGTENSIGTLFDNTNAPEILSSRLLLNARLAISERFGLRLFAPMVSQMHFTAHPIPGFESLYPDLVGETGLGDLLVGFWVSAMGNANSHLMLFGDIGIPTGSDPDDISALTFASTGSGLWSLSSGVAADLLSTETVMLSLMVNAGFQQTDTVKVDGETFHLNSPLQINLINRVKVKISPKLDVGLDLTYTYVEEVLANNYYQFYPEISSFILAPRFAYRVSEDSPDVDITGGYLLNFSGRAIYRFDGFDLGLQIYF